MTLEEEENQWRRENEESSILLCVLDGGVGHQWRRANSKQASRHFVVCGWRMVLVTC